jgi:uncharacterized membrane protein
VKFTDTGEVGILVAYREEQLCITITDEGPGIPKERMGNLFTPFQQLDDDPYKQHGSGLGLAICQSLTEQMGGVLTVESELGAGSRFEVSVPAPHSQETLTVSPESRPGEAEAVPQADNETVTQALCQLSPQQREQLREALEDGNRRHIREILVTMQALHPLATATLMRHLENFDYPWIADRLSDCPDDESGV